ncbi:Ninja-family protein AFP3 [Platanthera guangdongensis]|uniref:Ninja-family protein n=1 Tax=Platanthera guangdongensis TaxID=2320717 RepID=A0ABR2ME08_9ASPA
MELDLTAILNGNATPPVLSAAIDDGRPELDLDLSLKLSSGANCSSGKRLSGNDLADVEGKKSKVTAESSLETNHSSYGVEVIPVVFQSPNGFSCVVPCWIPSSGEKSVYRPVANWNIPATANLDSHEAWACRLEIADGASPPESSSRISNVVQISCANGESGCCVESRSNHSCSCSYGENPSPLPYKITKSHPVEKHSSIRAVPATRMQTVSTRSEEGKKIYGGLYRFSKNKVRIMCGCHGRLFAPADFVRHAGGKETAHPLRQIVVEVLHEL